MFLQLFFSKVQPACHNIANGINPGKNSKKLISILWIVQKLYVGAYSDLCEMYKVFIQQCCSYNNVTKGIRLLDINASLVYTGKIHASKSF